MQKFNGGQKVGKGTYWNLSNGHKVDIETEGMLPGDEKDSYKRFSSLFMLIVGPILGLLYVIIMPFLVIGTVAALAGGRLIGALFGIAGKSVSFGWRPANSYLAGKKKKENEKDPK